MDNNSKAPEERIALGECVSQRGVEHCPYCTDSCDAYHFKRSINDELESNKIIRPNINEGKS